MFSLSLDFDKLAGQLLPPFLKQAKQLAWVRALLSPLITLNDDVLAWTSETRKDLKTTGQIIVLEFRLNERYNGGGTEIYIEDNAQRLPRWYGYFKSEGQPALGYGYAESEGEPALGYGYAKSEYTGEIDFIVKVPAALTGYDENEMKAYVKRYAHAGKVFTIETY